MLHEDAINFENKIKSNIPFEEIELTDESFGYAVGWFYSSLKEFSPIPLKVASLTKNMEKYDKLKDFIIGEWKRCNKNISVENKFMTKLLGYVVMGTAEYTIGDIPERVQHSIILGYNMH